MWRSALRAVAWSQSPVIVGAGSSVSVPGTADLVEIPHGVPGFVPAALGRMRGGAGIPRCLLCANRWRRSSPAKPCPVSSAIVISVWRRPFVAGRWIIGAGRLAGYLWISLPHGSPITRSPASRRRILWSAEEGTQSKGKGNVDLACEFDCGDHGARVPYLRNRPPVADGRVSTLGEVNTDEREPDIP